MPEEEEFSESAEYDDGEGSEDKVDNDELSPEEEGFMAGYEKETQRNRKKEDEEEEEED